MEKIDQMKDVLNLIGLRHDDPCVKSKFTPEKEIDHLAIHKDLLNKVSKELIALKHKQPLCVINAIEDQTYDPKKGYVEDKIYSLSEFISIVNNTDNIHTGISKVFKNANSGVLKDGYGINAVKDYAKNLLTKFIIPIKNSSRIHSYLIHGETYIPLSEVAEIFNMGAKSTLLLGLVTRGYILRDMPIEKKVLNTIKLYKKEDVLKNKQEYDLYVSKKELAPLSNLTLIESRKIYTLISEKYNLNLISMVMNEKISKRYIKDIYMLKDAFISTNETRYNKFINLLEEYLEDKEWIGFNTYRSLITDQASMTYANEINKKVFHGFKLKDFKDKYNKPPFKDGMVNKDFLIEVLKHKLSKL